MRLKRFLILNTILFFVLKALDFELTVYGLNLGIIEEANPITATIGFNQLNLALIFLITLTVYKMLQLISVRYPKLSIATIIGANLWNLIVIFHCITTIF